MSEELPTAEELRAAGMKINKAAENLLPLARELAKSASAASTAMTKLGRALTEKHLKEDSQ